MILLLNNNTLIQLSLTDKITKDKVEPVYEKVHCDVKYESSDKVEPVYQKVHYDVKYESSDEVSLPEATQPPPKSVWGMPAVLSWLWSIMRAISVPLLIIFGILYFCLPPAEGTSSTTVPLPISPTDTTNLQIATQLGIIATNIESIASKVSAAPFDESIAATFIKSVVKGQGGYSPRLTPSKIVATQALRASIAKILSNSVLLQRHSPDKKGKLVVSTRQEIEEDISRLYQDWNSSLSKDTEELVDWNSSLSKDIEELVEMSLELAFAMNLPIVAHWMKPGDIFMEDRMKMTDISIFEGTVGLCVFPRWADSEDFTILKAKVYCVQF